MATLKFAKDMKSKMKQKNTLRRYAHTVLPYHDQPRPRTTIHASSLTSDPEYCAREQALLDAYKIKGKPRPIGACLSYTFSMGRMLEKYAVSELFGDISYSDWKCVYCKKVFHFQQKPKECSCGCRTFDHIERRFKDPITGASCGVDMFVRLPGRDRLTPVELKTESQDPFVKLSAPRIEHRQRSQIYLEIMDRDTENIGHLVDLSSIIVFYMLKGYGKKDDTLINDGLYETITPFKEYEVKRNPIDAEHFLSKAEKYNLFRKTGVVPGNLASCQTVTSPRAKKCSMCKECFSGELPAGTKLEPIEVVHEAD